MSKKLTLSEAEAAFERAKAELREARARETEEARKADLHRKIVAGAYLIKLLPEQPKLLQAFHDYLTPKDRKDFAAEFAALKPAASKEPAPAGTTAASEVPTKQAAPKTAPAAPVVAAKAVASMPSE